MCRFEGHGAGLVHYDWRVVDHSLYQLVSLDEAQTLRLWRLDAGVLRACGHVNPRSDDDPPPALPTSNPNLSSNEGRGGYYDTISPALAARLTPDALKSDLLPTTVSASQPQRPAQPPSSHAAVSVWQEMVEVRYKGYIDSFMIGKGGPFSMPPPCLRAPLSPPSFCSPLCSPDPPSLLSFRWRSWRGRGVCVTWTSRW